MKSRSCLVRWFGTWQDKFTCECEGITAANHPTRSILILSVFFDCTNCYSVQSKGSSHREVHWLLCCCNSLALFSSYQLQIILKTDIISPAYPGSSSQPHHQTCLKHLVSMSHPNKMPKWPSAGTFQCAGTASPSLTLGGSFLSLSVVQPP